MTVGDTVQLTVRNGSVRPLEFMIGRAPTESTFDVPFFGGVTMLRMAGPVVAAEIPTDRGPAREAGGMRHPQVYLFPGPDEAASVTFIVPPRNRGRWEMACFLEGHRREGMRGVVLVSPREG